MRGVSAAPPAPGERQTLSVSVYSHRMKKPATYHSNPSSRVPTGGVGRWRSHSAPSPIVPARKLNTTSTVLSSGEALKKKNFVGVLLNFAPQGIHPGYSAPSPIVPASKHYTTSTVLSSGEALKKTNSVGVLSNFAPDLASPSAPGGLARTRRRRHVEAWPARDSPWVRPGPGLRPEGSLSFPCFLPTANCWSAA